VWIAPCEVLVLHDGLAYAQLQHLLAVPAKIVKPQSMPILTSS
jgi:hypothetical protein